MIVLGLADLLILFIQVNTLYSFITGKNVLIPCLFQKPVLFQ